jgi:glycerate 2-kinase
MSPARVFLESLYRAAVGAAHPAGCLVPALPKAPKDGRVFVLAAGKAAGSMTEVAEQHYLDTLGLTPDRLTGLAVTRYGYGRPTRKICVIEAGHPIPDSAGLDATERLLALSDATRKNDLVLVLLSGGASANLIAPAGNITVEDKQAVTRALLRSGAAIDEVNVVRKHLSRVKGGRIAARAAPARIVTLAISDVPGDDPAVIGSGPTVPDPSTLADARAIVARQRIALPAAAARALDNPANESPKPGDPSFARSEFRLVARPADALRTAEMAVRKAGYVCISLGSNVEGEARDVGLEHARLARSLLSAGRRAAILSGGELTVTIRGNGMGGPNQEYALALALLLDGTRGITALAADTDGTDGGGGNTNDPAGAFADGTTLARARTAGLDPAAHLANNDSRKFFGRIGDLFLPGPTFTNVNDFRAILIDPP